MTTITRNTHTLTDVLNARGADGSLINVSEVLDKDMAIMKSAVWKEANDVTLHRFQRRNSLPVAQRRNIDEAYGATRGSRTNLEVTMETFSAEMSIGKDSYDIAPNKNEFMNEEARTYIESLGQAAEKEIIYGNGVTGKFDGLATILNATSIETVTSHAGTGSDLSSMYFVHWSPTTTTLVYPRGSMGGIKRDLKGEVITKTTNNAGVEGHKTEIVEQYDVTLGLCVQDIRAVARLANIDTEATINEAKVIEALYKMDLMYANQSVAYVSQKVYSLVQQASVNDSNKNFRTVNVFGITTNSIQEMVPLMVSNKIINSETVVS